MKREKQSPKRRFWRRALTSVLCSVVVLTLLFILPLPRWAVTRSAIWASGLLISDYDARDPAALKIVGKFVGLWLEQNLAADIATSQEISPNVDDSTRIALRLENLKRLLITQVELPHRPTDSPTLLTGLGWCDSINRVGAMVLAHDFSRAEIVSLYSPIARGGHSFGRVWSNQYHDWLYFDLWTKEVVVFRSNPLRGAIYLVRKRPFDKRSSEVGEGTWINSIRDNAYRGLVHNELQSNFGSYLLYRLGNILRYGSTVSPTIQHQLLELNRHARPDPMLSAPHNRTNANELYMRARLYDIYGNQVEARRAYERFLVAEGGANSVFEQAARIFISRLDTRTRSAYQQSGAHPERISVD